jgi:hypothetical protein
MMSKQSKTQPIMKFVILSKARSCHRMHQEMCAAEGLLEKKVWIFCLLKKILFSYQETANYS